MSPIVIVGYLALFVGLGAGFLLVNLLVGRLVRPVAPNTEKLEVYECGEPTIGSSFVQFDLRFYVVALLFIIFDVEVAFFFPWAVVFGKATHLEDPHFQPVVQTATADGTPQLAEGTRRTLEDLGVPNPGLPKPDGDLEENTAAIRDTSATLAKTSIADILVFFAVLMVGFAYVWMRGDLDWVRALSRERAAAPNLGLSAAEDIDEPALVS